ncbi:MAG: heavy metal-binding domain-containing protein [Bacteroidota bacterium]
MKVNGLTIRSFIFLIGMFFSSCHSHPKAEKGDYAYTAAYICPMHCAGSGSDQPGECPVCKMDYEKNEAHEEETHHQGGQ